MYITNFDEFKSYVNSLEVKDTDSLMVLVGDKSESTVSDLMEFLNSKKINFFGGIYSGLLVRGNNERTGYIVKKVEPIYSSLVLPFMMRIKMDISELSGATAIVLVDGLSSKMKDLTDTVYSKLGTSVKYVGGGAGFYNMSHNPCIFNNNGIYKDALHICIVKSEALVAVEHGWKKLRGPFKVSKSYDNVLAELDNEKAFEVYKHVIEEEENIILSQEGFFTFAKDHPFGIDQGFGRVIVRDPYTINEHDEIVCVANIPEGCQVYVLKGDSELLLDSSIKIASICAKDAPEEYTPLLFDCISRAMFLENAFIKELNNIQEKMKFDVEGALSIGEISSKPNGEIVIHNKSTVLALLYN
ncbi:MAG: hypothetical protein K0R50_891 [Eubacterium sp.]|jgi:hypothetical protein|nr:hypothetical protein [Eubacterium sp.]